MCWGHLFFLDETFTLELYIQPADEFRKFDLRVYSTTIRSGVAGWTIGWQDVVHTCPAIYFSAAGFAAHLPGTA